MSSKGEKLVLEEEAMLKAINEVKKALAKMEKCFKKGEVKNSRDIAGRDEAEEEKTPWRAEIGDFVESEIKEAQKESLEAEADTSSAVESKKTKKDKGAPAEDSESESESEDESRENTEEWTSNMPAVYSD